MSALTREQNKQISIDFLTKPNLNLVSKHPESFNNFSSSVGNCDSSIEFIFLNNIFWRLESFLFSSQSVFMIARYTRLRIKNSRY